jgi:putative ABC transport system substrate-binding protein
MPVIGFLEARSPDAMADRLRGLRQGLGETGYVEGDNVTILYRWAENKIESKVTGINFFNSELVAKQLT